MVWQGRPRSASTQETRFPISCGDDGCHGLGVSPAGLRGSYSTRSAEILAPSKQAGLLSPTQPMSLRHSEGRRSSLPIRKKSTPEPRAISRKNKGGRSPLLPRRPLAESAGVSVSASRLRPSANSESALSSTASQLEGTFSQDESDLADTLLGISAANGGSSYEPGADEVEGAADAQRTKHAIEALQAKIHKTMDLIKIEQQEKEENVNEYLRLSANADRQQQQRIKTVFEKRNQKSTSMLAQLQRKLESYQKRLRDVEMYGVSGHKQAKEVLRDMGQGLKDVGANIRDGLTGFSGGVVENIKGAKDKLFSPASRVDERTIVSKPKEFARHLIKNKFGSADNISNIKQLEESQGSADDADKHSHHGGTLPASFKYPPSDDETSSVTSGSAPSGLHHSPRSAGQLTSTSQLAVGTACSAPSVDLEPILIELQESRQQQYKLQESVEALKAQLSSQYSFLKQALEEESERLEEQINDLTELHQHEVTNIKQEFASMEEKMEYQLEERTRDMQELLETCQTRITKMELAQQQQQLISMEGIENSNFRALITKMINVVLALLAVLLVFVSTCANLLGPFLTTRLRVLTTICLIASIVAVWKNWLLVQDYGRHLVDQYKHLLPAQ